MLVVRADIDGVGVGDCWPPLTTHESKVGGVADIDGSGVGDCWPLQHINKLFVRIAAAYNTMAATRASPWNRTEASGSGLQLFHSFLPSKLNVRLSPYKSFTWVTNSFTVTYLQELIMVGNWLEEMRIKRRDLGQRMHHKLPPHDLLERVMRSVLMANIRKKMTKEERKAIIKVGTEDNVKYQSKDVVKQKKTGGLRNKQKKHKKAMLDAAKRSKIERSKYQKFHESVCPLNDTKCILQDLRPLFTKLPHKSLPNLLLISNEIRTTRAGGHGKNNFLEVLMLLKLKRNSEIWDFEHGMRSGDEGQDLISELDGGTTSTVCIGESSLKRLVTILNSKRIHHGLYCSPIQVDRGATL
ncbi:hypothetical protein Tco_0918101, partial [Tanacetum coccineum]